MDQFRILSKRDTLLLVELSKRILKVKPSVTLALNAKANQLIKQGQPVINFGVGEPDFGTPQPIIDRAIESLRAGRTRYGAAGGGPDLKRAILSKLKRDQGLEFSSDEIVAGSGSKELLFHIFLTLLNDGDEVILPSPYWVSYADQILAAGGVPVPLPMIEPGDKDPIPLDALEDAITPKTRAIVINSPNNPSGYAFSKDFAGRLAKVLERHPFAIISDEIYEYLSFESPHLSLLQVEPNLRSRMILVNGLSKGFAMTGWRVGYCAAPVAIAKLVQSLESHSSTCIPGFIEDAAALALDTGRSAFSKEIEELNRRRQAGIEILKTFSNIQVIEPQGAFYFFLDIRKVLERKGFGQAGNWRTADFCEKLLTESHLAVVPGEAFGAPGFIRLSYTVEMEKMKEGLARLKKATSID